MNDTKTLVIDAEAVGQRVDAYLAKMLPELSRARIQNMLASGHIHAQGSVVKPSHRLLLGEELSVTIPEAAPTQMQAEALELNVLYEDADLVVINKPAGLVVHPGAGHASGTLANALLHRYPDMHVGDSQRPGLVHRLDKDTSGVMVCARHDASFAALAKDLESREVKKIYRAFCYGKLKEQSFELITGHARHKNDRTRYTTKIKAPEEYRKGVRIAHSHFKSIMFAGGISEVQVELFTGRTHQIRAHLADLHHPLLQDDLYGGGSSRMKQLPHTIVRDAVRLLERHALHAEQLSFKHPTSGKSMDFHAQLPADLQAVHEALVAEIGV